MLKFLYDVTPSYSKIGEEWSFILLTFQTLSGYYNNIIKISDYWLNNQSWLSIKASGILVIGGGVIGTAVGYGLAELGAQVNLLDQGGSTPNASRGNFGLVWVQSKGLGMLRYAEWGCVRDECARWQLRILSLILMGNHRRESALFVAVHLSYRSLWESWRKVQTDEARVRLRRLLFSAHLLFAACFWSRKTFLSTFSFTSCSFTGTWFSGLPFIF